MTMSCLLTPLVASIQNLPRPTIKLSDPRHGRCQNPTMSVNRKPKVAARTKMSLIDIKDEPYPFEGRLLKLDSIFQQSFSVMSYEVDRNQTITVEALMNYMKETSINHPNSLEVNSKGFGCTPEMHRRNLTWVSRATQISFHRYPSRGNIVVANTWFNASKRGLRREWLLHDAKTGETVLKAVSLFVMMNMSMRKLSTFSVEILSELEPHARNCDPLIHFDKRVRRMDITEADHVRANLTPMWNDIDSNAHVSNVTYINWIIEGVPRSILEKNVLDNISLEYRRECSSDSELQSLSSRVKGDLDRDPRNKEPVEFNHLLQLNDGTEIARAKTKWRPRLEPLCEDSTTNSQI